MSWPLSHDFNEAVQNPQTAFADPDLKTGETVVGATGLPLPRSGNFADVYQVRGADGRDWAVKCFTRPVAGLADRYARVSETLAKANLPFTVGFTFLAEGIRVGGAWRPVVKMEWVEGLLLNQVLRDNAGKPAVLSALGQMWVKLCKRLREAGVAHADLQHGNVLLVPGSRAGAYGLKLIDYDGMWVSALANTPSGESGHPSYQHPARAATRAYSQDVDRFPHLVVTTALRGLAVGGPALWERYDNGDNLLFTEQDYRKPAESNVMRELWQTGDPALQALVGRLAISCGKPIPQTPWLDQFAPDGEPLPLDNNSYREAATALGVALPVPVGLPPESSFEAVEKQPAPTVPPPPAPRRVSPVFVAPTNASDEDETDVELVESPRPKKKGKSKPEEVTKSNARTLLLAGGGVLLLVGVAVAGVLIAGNKSKQTETVLQKPDEPNEPVTKGADEVPKSKNKGSNPVAPKPKDPAPNPVPKTADRLEVRFAWSADLPAKFEIDRFPSCSSDSRTVLAIGGPRGALVALDAVTGRPIPCEFDPPQQLEKVCPVNGGRFAFLSDAKNTTAIPVVNPRTGRVDSLEATPHNGRVLQFVSPDLRYVAVGAAFAEGSQPFQLKRVADGNIILSFDWVRGHVLFTADSSRVLVAEYNGRCRWFKLPSGERVGEWMLQPSKTAKEGRYLFGGSTDGSVLLYEGFLADRTEAYHVINGRTGAIIRSLPGSYKPHDASFSADGALVVLPKWADNKYLTADVVSTATGTILAEIIAPAGCDTLRPALLPDGNGVIAIVGPPAKVVRYDLVVPGSKPQYPPDVPLPEPEPILLKSRWNVPANTEGAQATIQVRDQTILWGSARTSLAAFDLLTGEKRPPFGLIELTGGDAFSPLDRGRVAKYVPDDTVVRTWDVRTGKPGEKVPVATIPPGGGNAKQKLAWLSPNGKYLVVARGAPTPVPHEEVPFEVFATDKTGKTLVDVKWVGGTVHFTADSSRLLVAEYSGRFRWFTLTEESEPQGWDYPQPADGCTHLATSITANGRVVGYNGPARSKTGVGPCLADGKTGDVVHRFGKGYAERSPVVLSSDGRVAAVLREMAGTDATIEVVSVPKGTVLGWAMVATKGAVPTFALSDDARVLLVHDPKAGTLWRFDLP